MADENNDIHRPSQQDNSAEKSGDDSIPSIGTSPRNTLHREGEFIVSVPEPDRVDARRMKPGERVRYQELDSEAEQKRLDALASQIMQQKDGIRIPASLKRFCTLGLLAVAAVLMLLMVGQVTNFLAELNRLPTWSQWVIGSMLAIIVGIVLYLVFYLISLSLRLKKNDQINFAAIKALKEREALRSLAKRQESSAVVKLKSYLEAFPVKEEAKFLELGLAWDDYSALLKVRTKLLDQSGTLECQDWLEIFKSEFQIILDKAALERVKSFAKTAAIKTAVSPLPILDTGIVLAISLAMVRDIMTLYNLRMNSAGVGHVLLRSVGQAYLAGGLQDMTENLGDLFSNLINSHTSPLIAQVGGKVVAKVGEGTANGVMIYKLGRATTKLLQPSC